MRTTILGLIVMSFLLAACNHTAYEPIDKSTDFVASVNIEEPSIDFIDANGKQLAVWPLSESYSGATLVGDDRIFLYGHNMDHADLIQLSTGKQLAKIDTGEGTTNAMYNATTKQLYAANSEANTVTAYDEDGTLQHTRRTGNYPMSMLTYDDQLFVVNFKDTTLSVLDAQTLTLKDEWTIPKSSNGLIVIDDELWIGGHGTGSKPNDTIERLNIHNGEKLSKLTLPMMPIAFLKQQQHVYVLSHGENVLHQLGSDGKRVAKVEVASNPFALASFAGSIIVAGYDDHKIYWTKQMKVEKSQDVGEGPFQLLVREK